MARTPPEFEAKYPHFIGLAFDFSDPPPGCESEDEIARDIRSDWPDVDRIEIFKRLLADSERLLQSLDVDWKALEIYLHYRFSGVDEAKSWLTHIRGIWKDELERLQRTKG